MKFDKNNHFIKTLFYDVMTKGLPKNKMILDKYFEKPTTNSKNVFDVFKEKITQRFEQNLSKEAIMS
jgi:hypothetical protein